MVIIMCVTQFWTIVSDLFCITFRVETSIEDPCLLCEHRSRQEFNHACCCSRGTHVNAPCMSSYTYLSWSTLWRQWCSVVCFLFLKSFSFCNCEDLCFVSLVHVMQYILHVVAWEALMSMLFVCKFSYSHNFPTFLYLLMCSTDLHVCCGRVSSNG